MNISEKISVSIQVLTLIAASPDNSGTKITLLNTGKSNLYIQKIEIGDQTFAYDRPRLLATGTLDSSYYWVNPPESLPLDKDFDLKVYVTDEFGTKWLSEHGGQVHQYNGNRVLNTWSYRTEKL